MPYQENTTLLLLASKAGHHDVVQTLLGAGADVNAARSDVSNDILLLWSDGCRNLMLWMRCLTRCHT